MLTLEQLKVLQAVAEEDSVKAAAQRLYKTQPALSHGIKQLETSLGVALFTRDNYRLALTPAGRVIYQMAKKTLNSAREIEHYAEHLRRGNEEQLVIAIEAAFQLETIFSVLESIQIDFPHTQVILKQEYLSGAIERLVAGDAQIAITAVPIELTANHDKLLTKTIARGTMVNVASPKLMARHSELKSIEELINEYQVVVQDTGSETGNTEFNTQTAQRRWYVNNFETKLRLIVEGMGWGMLPSYMVESKLDSGELIEIVLEEHQSRFDFPNYLVRNKEELLGPVTAQLWQRLASASNNT